jgi:peptide/nickel transport system permease protein
MTQFVIRRIASTILVLAIASVAVFSLLQLAPGDPASVLAGPDATPETIAAIRHSLGLDMPLATQYFSWVGHLLTGNLGDSYSYHRPVAELIGQRLGSTVELTITATMFMVLLGLVMGVILATTRSRGLRRAIDGLSTFFLALPPFASGIILIFFFAVMWHALPSGGEAPLFAEPASSIRRLILPAIALALPAAPVIANLLATEMAHSRDQEFILTALAKGANRQRITWRHVVPNSLSSPIIEVAIHIGNLLGGAVVAEAIFARNGLGTLLIQAVDKRDYQLAQVLLLLAIAAAIIVQLIAELCIARIDPRIRLGRSS